MDSLQEILGKRDFTPPDEIASVKEYIQRRYKSTSRVRVERGVIIVRVPSGGLAATIQLEQRRLIEACNLKKKLVIRTGR